MIDEICTIIESFKVPYCKQGSASVWATYPETFITFWNNDSPDHAHYDDSRFGTAWDYNVYVYSSDPDITYSLLDQLREAFEEAGWICPSKGFDAASDEPSHSGRGIQIYKLEIGG